MAVPEPREPIAVVGVSALFPGSADVGGFWRDVLAGRDLITDVPPSHWLVEDYFDPDPSAPDKTYCRRGAFLDPQPFDPLEHGVPPNVVPATDTAQLLALIVARQVLEDATQGQFARLDRERASVILGLTSAQELVVEMGARLQRPIWARALRQGGLPEDEVSRICDRIAASYSPWQEMTFPGLLGNVAAGRIANRLDLHGTNCVTDAACASAFSALSMALNELYLGDSDLVIAGGVDTFNDIFMYMCFSKTPAMSPTGDCRPFDADADGTMLGEGIGMVALRRLADAERDGNRVYAVIRGLGSSSDGRAKSIYAPVAEGQARSLRRAYALAGYGPETVELVEAHGTGTKAGDVAEFDGLRTVFEESGRKDRQWCALGSIKSQIGHTKAAAGVAGLLKAVLALHHKVLPPTIKVTTPNPALEIGKTPFYLNTEARPWVRGSSHPRRAAVSSFGFGGSNFHVTAEEYRGASRAFRLRTAPSELLLLSAATPEALAGRARELAADGGPLTRLARETQGAFETSLPARLAVVATDLADLGQKLEKAAAHLAASPEKPLSAPNGIHYALGAEPGRVAFLFSGQGSQHLGMGADLAMAFETCRAVWDRVADLRLGDVPLHEVVFPRPVFTDADREALGRRLTATEWAQPAIGATSAALLALVESLGLRPDAVAGHSFGEVTALHAAGVLGFEDFLRVARRRGELMAAAAEVPGAMLAVAHPAEALRPMVEGWGTGVVLANLNSPRQVVLSGPTAAIEEAQARLREAGLTARRLPVSTAFHSPLVSPSSAPFGEFLLGVAFSPGRLPVFSNSEAAPYPAEADAMRALLASQIARPVRFAEEIEALWSMGVRTFVEVGPGSIQTQLVGECLEGREHRAVSLDRKGQHGLTSLWNGLGRLAVGGLRLEWARLWDGCALPKPADGKKPALTLPICGANYGRPYPPPPGAAEPPAPVPPAKRAPATPKPSQAAAPAAAPAPAPVPAPVPAPATAPALAPTLPPGAGTAWVQAFQELQRQTVEAHAAYQRTMAESHAGFLRMAEASLSSLAGVLGGSAVAAGLPAAVPVPPPPALPEAPRPIPAPAVVTPAAPVDAAATVFAVVAEKTGYPADMLRPEMQLESDLGIDSIKRVEILSALQERLPAVGEVQPGEIASLRTLGQIVERLTSAAPAEAAPAPSAAGAAAGDLHQALLSVVAEKTGYPADMLRPEMALEADLGIDSIKRVEILSALQSRLPGLPEVQPGEMGSLRTLGQILARLEGAAGAAPGNGGGAAAPARSSAADLERLLREVVAEKTGYPADMLRPEMALEADLGIDSIKRVEILSALRDRTTAIPEIPAAEMARLRTLGQIVDWIHAGEKGPDGGDGPDGPGGGQRAGPGQGPGAGPGPATAGLGRFEVREVPAPAVGLALAGLHTSGAVAVTDDGAGVAPALVARLRASGFEAAVVAEVPAGAGVVIVLDGLRALSSVDDALRVNEAAFAAARAAAPRLAEKGGVFVTVQDTGGDFGLGGRDPLRAWAAGLPALVKTAAQEWPLASLRAIDVERAGRTAEAVAEVIAAELERGGLEREVGLHADGRRTTLAAVETAAEAATEPVLPEGAVVLATGGARGVTAAALLGLARTRRLRFALVGRTRLGEEPEAARGVEDEAALRSALLAAARAAGRTLPPAELRAEVASILARREVRRTLAALQALGSEACYLAVDAQDASALGAALDPVRREWGPVRGLVHGAGVLADKRIVDKTPEAFRRVFDTKVAGLRALLEATASDPLRALVLFSSVAARAGNAGQSDYAMANAVLDAVASAEAARRGPSCLVRSLAWGPWAGGMVTPALAAHFERAGVPLIPLDSGADLFAAEVASAPGPVQVVIGGRPKSGALGEAEGQRAGEAEVVASAGLLPFLSGHRIQGTPVVPAVIALEWLARAARACRPDLALLRCTDLRVLKGIRLDSARFEGGGEAFRLSAREIPGDGPASGLVRLSLELRGEGGLLHYSAAAEMGPPGTPLPALSGTAPAPRPALPSRPTGLEPPAFSRVYGEMLFHGPEFQVIRSLESLSPEGGAALLGGTEEAGWPGGPWITDPAALDGGLQLAILWGIRVLGKRTLPTHVGCFVPHRPGPARGRLRCSLRPREIGGYRTVSDLAFADEDGSLVAELREVEMHAVPGGEVEAAAS